MFTISLKAHDELKHFATRPSMSLIVLQELIPFCPGNCQVISLANITGCGVLVEPNPTIVLALATGTRSQVYTMALDHACWTGV